MIPIAYTTHLYSSQIENQLIEAARDILHNPLEHYVKPPYKKNTKRGVASIKKESLFNISKNYFDVIPKIEYDYRFLNAIKNDPNTPVAAAYVEEHLKNTPHFLFWKIAQQTANNFDSIEVDGTPENFGAAIESFSFKPEQHLSTGNGFVKDIYIKRKRKQGSYWITIDFGFTKLESEVFHSYRYKDNGQDRHYFQVDFGNSQKENVRDLLFLHQIDKYER